jgi:DNA polymerase elongation subunit (family B)
MFTQEKQSLLSVVLERWFNERVEYKNKMKEAYKVNDKEKGEYYFLMQYTMKILLNSLYGATALPRFRYGNVILAESITLTGQRLIQASAYHANHYFNNILNNKIKLEL